MESHKIWKYICLDIRTIEWCGLQKRRFCALLIFLLWWTQLKILEIYQWYWHRFVRLIALWIWQMQRPSNDLVTQQMSETCELCSILGQCTKIAEQTELFFLECATLHGDYIIWSGLGPFTVHSLSTRDRNTASTAWHAILPSAKHLWLLVMQFNSQII